jgi:hypothetical protein
LFEERTRLVARSFHAVRNGRAADQSATYLQLSVLYLNVLKSIYLKLCCLFILYEREAKWNEGVREYRHEEQK